MEITYIRHSAFAVILPTCSLLFDYYAGELPAFPKDRPLYVFASHKHGDHFHLCIFELAKEYENITYILSNDIKLNEKYLERKGIDPFVKSKIISIGKNQSLSAGRIFVETLKSTDEGVAFIVKADNRQLYHAGDLNWWYWEAESKEWNDGQERDYRHELSLIRGRHFDAAFVPVDPRLSSGYHLGLDTFLEYVSADYIFPMHVWGEFQIITAYIKHADMKAGNIVEIKRDGECFQI